MAKKGGIEFDELLKLGAKLDELAGDDGIIRAVESAMKATDQYVTKEVENAIASSKFNFDRGTGRTKKSLEKNIEVEWDGMTARVRDGFILKEGGKPSDGMTSIYLMYGTPLIKPDTKLKNAVRGTGKHKKEIQKIQSETFQKVIERVMRND